MHVVMYDRGRSGGGGGGGEGPGLKSSKKEGVQPLKLGNLHHKYKRRGLDLLDPPPGSAPA